MGTGDTAVDALLEAWEPFEGVIDELLAISAARTSFAR